MKATVLPYIFICASIGATAAGTCVGLMQIKIFSGGTGIFAMANFIDTQIGSMTGMIQMAGCIALGVAVTFVLTMLLYKDKEKTVSAKDQDALAADMEANA